MKKKKEIRLIDKKVLEYVFTEQQEELEARVEETLCHRKEEKLLDLKSTQAQCVIGVRRSGKSTMCYQALHEAGLKYAYADFDDERLVGEYLRGSNVVYYSKPRAEYVTVRGPMDEDALRAYFKGVFEAARLRCTRSRLWNSAG